MPRPIPVYMVSKQSFGERVIVALLICGLAVALLKLAIIAALGLGALYLALRGMLAAPGLFFSVAIWGGGLYLVRQSTPLMVGWTVLWFVILAMILARGHDATEKAPTFKALPAPDA